MTPDASSGPVNSASHSSTSEPDTRRDAGGGLPVELDELAGQQLVPSDRLEGGREVVDLGFGRGVAADPVVGADARCLALEQAEPLDEVRVP